MKSRLTGHSFWSSLCVSRFMTCTYRITNSNSDLSTFHSQKNEKKPKQKICVFANEPKNEDQKVKSKKTSCTRYSLCRYVNLHDYEIEIRAEQKPMKKFNERTDGEEKKVDSNSVSSCSIVINGHEIIIVYLPLLLLLFAACFRCFSIQK